ncbi:MAG: outer membrane lipoprotein-sorting protein [Kiritimatiellia bacterium]|jgi:outer membrane lipoprotein-sorting protein
MSDLYSMASVLLSSVLLSTTSVAAEPTADAILTGVQVASSFDTNYSESRQIITTSSGRDRTLTMRGWTTGGGDKQLVEYTSPSNVAGQKMLTTGFGDNIWMFNPETNRSRKLGSHMKKKKVMGSDFTYEDQDAGDIRKRFTGTLLRSESLDGVDCWVLHLRPTSEGPSYRTVHAWVSKPDHVMRRADFYLGDNPDAQKRLIAGDIRTVGQRQVAHTITMKNLADGTQTVVHVDTVQYGVQIPDSAFDPARLGH